MDNETRDYLEGHFVRLHARDDALKDSINVLQLQLTTKITRHDEQIFQHSVELDKIGQRGWQMLLGIATGAASLGWQGINAMFGKHH